MLVLRAQQLFCLLILTNLAFAARFRFTIQEIDVGLTRDLNEDDVILAIASTTGFGTINNTWTLGSAKTNATFKWSNLTQEFEVPANAANLSVAIAASNSPDADEKTVQDLVEGTVALATSFLPLGKLFETLVGFFAGLLKCDGPVIADNIIYAPGFLTNMTKDQKACDKKNYTYAPPNVLCGTDDSVYTVTYCIERLDAKTSTAASLLPGSLSVWTTVALAVVCGCHSLFL